MAQAVVSPRIRGFICTTAHPDGCARNVEAQIAVALKSRRTVAQPCRALVVGSSTGYGLASRIAATGLYDADTVGVFYEREGDGAKTGTPGYYNTAAFQRYAGKAGRLSLNFNGDAFSSEIKDQVVSRIKETMGQVDVVIYSLASPRRIDPRTGEEYRSALKPIGASYIGKTIDLNREVITEVTLEPATEDEIRSTVAVMGGDDLQLWTQKLLEENALAEGARVVPFSYIGPRLTWAMYRSGTMGRAKEDLEHTTTRLNTLLRDRIGGRAIVSINKAVITQASTAIPAMPLYISLVYRLMREQGTHEDPIHQMVRLFTDHIGPGATPTVDDEGRIRLDDLEMHPSIQQAIERQWGEATTENFRAISDYDAFKRGFRQLFGFEADGIDYEKPVEVETSL
jgi:enoyl-[acyl-carrier protein] reductase/trans-2-enoyl-CoA reductase (NAD+)